jgi:hypothetical protein
MEQKGSKGTKKEEGGEQERRRERRKVCDLKSEI